MTTSSQSRRSVFNLLAIQRHRHYEIDIIILRSLVYALATGVLAFVYVSRIVILQQLFTALTGQQSTVAIVGLTLLSAAIVQTLSDRRFYRRQYDAEAMLAHFGTAARDKVNLGTPTAKLLDVMDRTVQPAGTSLWMRDRQP